MQISLIEPSSPSWLRLLHLQQKYAQRQLYFFLIDQSWLTPVIRLSQDGLQCVRHARLQSSTDLVVVSPSKLSELQTRFGNQRTIMFESDFFRELSQFCKDFQEVFGVAADADSHRLTKLMQLVPWIQDLDATSRQALKSPVVHFSAVSGLIETREHLHHVLQAESSSRRSEVRHLV